MSFVGGKLKLKGGVDVSQLKGGVKKKKKKAKSSPAAGQEQAIVAVEGGEGEQQAQQQQGGEGGDQAAQVGRSSEGVALDPEAVKDRRTAAEKKADEHFMKYEQQRARKLASKSHRERIKELNERLATETEVRRRCGLVGVRGRRGGCADCFRRGASFHGAPFCAHPLPPCLASLVCSTSTCSGEMHAASQRVLCSCFARTGRGTFVLVAQGSTACCTGSNLMRPPRTPCRISYTA